jgi:hypothetical protein
VNDSIVDLERLQFSRRFLQTFEHQLVLVNSQDPANFFATVRLRMKKLFGRFEQLKEIAAQSLKVVKFIDLQFLFPSNLEKSLTPSSSSAKWMLNCVLASSVFFT